ncbi:hypothetical protein O181_036436, partial [Austropuccinia psidii MF-1]|nr:hypothetical protein [Austropuccinia psidii MF-1]
DENNVDGEGGLFIEEEETPTLLSLTVSSVNDNWTRIHDSGVSRSTVRNLNMLFNSQPTLINMKMLSGTAKITNVGKLNFNGFIIHPVYYSPNGKSNLISKLQLEDNRLIFFRKKKMIIDKAGYRVVQRFNRKGNLYVADLNPPNPIINNILSKSIPNWHLVLTHPSYLYPKKILNINNLK